MKIYEENFESADNKVMSRWQDSLSSRKRHFGSEAAQEKQEVKEEHSLGLQC